MPLLWTSAAEFGDRGEIQKGYGFGCLEEGYINTSTTYCRIGQASNLHDNAWCEFWYYLYFPPRFVLGFVNIENGKHRYHGYPD